VHGPQSLAGVDHHLSKKMLPEHSYRVVTKG
jgi:hypothetical protein